MAADKAQSAEGVIERVLLQQWDPLGVHEQPGAHPEYAPYAHDLFGLLMRGASDVQVERRLRQIERDELHRPDADARDLSAVVAALRAVERSY
ncbi:MAG: hypothetical protein ACXWZS_09785 [Gemmatirosa sp.]